MQSGKSVPRHFGFLSPLQRWIVGGLTLWVMVYGNIQTRAFSEKILDNGVQGRALILEHGWISNRHIDLSDIQYRNFRASLGTQVVLAIVYLVLSKTVQFFVQRNCCTSSSFTTTTTTITTAASTSNDTAPTSPRFLHEFYPKNERHWPLLWFYAITGVCIATAIHGTSILFMLILLVVNYYIGVLIGHWKGRGGGGGGGEAMKRDPLGNDKNKNESKEDELLGSMTILTWLYNVAVIAFLYGLCSPDMFTFAYWLGPKYHWIDECIPGHLNWISSLLVFIFFFFFFIFFTYFILFLCSTLIS
ncbi:hypothetical protein RFI_24553 [Reticulomyxa filosa]|uniref:Uncharacterized protein n=1 Tax=Reticulomyxa filosa TaxID=46433 RepID=X6MHB7_RETFI|nr:hypothetical protein RFI_24553 [Reticulomyxa filosa]|eukprot:ETO12822.1 hypothetical protein RFI_24553 [Reticulomyxa filosa]